MKIEIPDQYAEMLANHFSISKILDTAIIVCEDMILRTQNAEASSAMAARNISEELVTLRPALNGLQQSIRTSYFNNRGSNECLTQGLTT